MSKVRTVSKTRSVYFNDVAGEHGRRRGEDVAFGKGFDRKHFDRRWHRRELG